jgi:beta-glucosidase
MRGRTYRYFEGEPLYPFGHGLSYTRFAYSNLKVDRSSVSPDGTAQVSVLVKNTGSRAGDEVVQLYVRAVDSKQFRARKELRGFERLTLKPGEQRRVSFPLTPSRDLTYYDEQRKTYAVDPGKYEIQVGASSEDIRLRTNLAVSDTGTK